MAITIKNEDLKLFLKVLRNHPYEITQGTETAFINSYLMSAFTPVADKKFESWITWFAYRIKSSKKTDENGHLTPHIIKVLGNKTTRAYNFDTGCYFDMEDGLSFTQMREAIAFTCKIYGFEQEPQYYCSPYMLYVKIMNDDKLEQYIEDIGMPPLEAYYQLREVREQMLKAWKNGKDYYLETFYPEKLIWMASCYMYRKEKETIMQIYDKYGIKSPHFEMVQVKVKHNI